MKKKCRWCIVDKDGVILTIGTYKPVLTDWEKKEGHKVKVYKRK